MQLYFFELSPEENCTFLQSGNAVKVIQYSFRRDQPPDDPKFPVRTPVRTPRTGVRTGNLLAEGSAHLKFPFENMKIFA